jgi:hypothetical protein
MLARHRYSQVMFQRTVMVQVCKLGYLWLLYHFVGYTVSEKEKNILQENCRLLALKF